MTKLHVFLLALCWTGTAARLAKSSNLRSQGGKKVKLDQPCVAVLAAMDHEPSSPLREETDLYCETPDGKTYQVIVSSDWIQEKRKRKELFSGRTTLTFSKNVFIDESTQTIDLADVPPGLVNRPNDDPNRKLRATTGNLSVLAVRVLTNDDQSLGLNEADLELNVFSPTNTNLKTQMSDCSLGQLEFQKPPSRTGATVSTDSGVVTVSVDRTSADGHASIRNAAIDALNAEFGVGSPYLLADHIMFCLPEASMSMIAYGYLDYWLTAYRSQWCLSLSAQMHELGHNLNLEHANDFNYLSSSNANTQYDDKVGTMGSSYTNYDIPKRCFNPAKSWQLGWYTLKQDTYTPTCGAVTKMVGSIVDYNNDLVDTVLLQVLQPTDGDVHYYMNYNARTGFNEGTQEAANRLVINKQGGNGQDVAFSQLEAILDVNQEFVIQDFDGITGDTLKIRYDSRSGRVVTLTLEWIPSDASKCSASTPTLNPTPPPTPPPTWPPTPNPTPNPTPLPTLAPVVAPTLPPTLPPTFPPTSPPTPPPTPEPVVTPTLPPTPSPTKNPTSPPTLPPTAPPTSPPTSPPTPPPVATLTLPPTPSPTMNPTPPPTLPPTAPPTTTPTPPPTPQPVVNPTLPPTPLPTPPPTATKTFVYAGRGYCTDVNGQMYDVGEARNIRSISACEALCKKSVVGADDSDLRGFSYRGKNNRCECNYDNGSPVVTACSGAYFQTCDSFGIGSGPVAGSTNTNHWECYAYN